MIEKVGKDGFIATGESVGLVRLVALKGALRLEMRGLRRRGKSASKLVSELFPEVPKRDKEALLKRLQEEIDKLGLLQNTSK